MRDYYRQTLQLMKRQSYKELVAMLSPGLSTDVNMRMGRWIMQCNPWMRECEPEFLRELFTRMERQAFAVREKIEASRLNVLCLGVVAYQGKIITATEGFVWGDILLSARALRNMSPARALTYVEVTVLTREAVRAEAART